MAEPVRQPINVASLEAYLQDHAPQIQTPLDVQQFGYGQSNPTYLLTSPNGHRYVLRKKPPGALLSQTAHKVEREYRVLSALSATDVPVPTTYCLCEDPTVLGTPFYIMAFLNGRIFHDATMPNVSSPPERRQLWLSAIYTLACLHRVDFRNPALRLHTYGKPEGFYPRQVATWRSICVAQAQALDVDTHLPVGPIHPRFDELTAFFADAQRQPPDRACLIHGDYKIDNLVFHPSSPHVIGILDWEMSTIGHPLSDVVNFLAPFTTASLTLAPDHNDDGGGDSARNSNNSRDPVWFGSDSPDRAAFLPGVTPGLPTRDELLEVYARASGGAYDPRPDMVWGEAFGMMRAAGILQGIAARVARRQASSAVAEKFAGSFTRLGELAWRMVEDEKGKVKAKAKAKDRLKGKL